MLLLFKTLTALKLNPIVVTMSWIPQKNEVSFCHFLPKIRANKIEFLIFHHNTAICGSICAEKSTLFANI